jgi:hypothetical protein
MMRDTAAHGMHACVAGSIRSAAAVGHRPAPGPTDVRGYDTRTTPAPTDGLWQPPSGHHPVCASARRARAHSAACTPDRGMPKPQRTCCPEATGRLRPALSQGSGLQKSRHDVPLLSCTAPCLASRAEAMRPHDGRLVRRGASCHGVRRRWPPREGRARPRHTRDARGPAEVPPHPLLLAPPHLLLGTFEP